ncbi:MAG: hypothetical protein QM760_21670 [Nibricoccus sp.]
MATKLLDAMHRRLRGAVTVEFGGMSPRSPTPTTTCSARLLVWQAHDVGGAIGVTHAAQAAQAEMASR